MFFVFAVPMSFGDISNLPDIEMCCDVLSCKSIVFIYMSVCVFFLSIESFVIFIDFCAFVPCVGNVLCWYQVKMNLFLHVSLKSGIIEVNMLECGVEKHFIEISHHVFM